MNIVYLCGNKNEIMKLQEFFKKTYPHEKESFSKDYHVRPRIVCNDGFSFSVQASVGAYCSPRMMLEDGCYYDAEIGFPSIAEPLINKYAENHSDYTKTVYGWVPIFLIEEVIKKHGGINKSETFKTKYYEQSITRRLFGTNERYS